MASVSRDAKPVEEESKPWEEDKQDYDYVEETPMKSEDGESPVSFLPEEGSGGFEGSGAEVPPMKDQPYETTEAEMGSGETDLDLGNFLRENVNIWMNSVVS